MEAWRCTTYHAQERWYFQLELFIPLRHLNFLDLATQLFFRNSTYQWSSICQVLEITFKTIHMLALSIIVSTFPASHLIVLAVLDGNSSYFNLDMLYTNPQLLTQLEQEYYANKTG